MTVVLGISDYKCEPGGRALDGTVGDQRGSQLAIEPFLHGYKYRPNRVPRASIQHTHILRLAVGITVSAQLEGECVPGSGSRDYKEALDD